VVVRAVDVIVWGVVQGVGFRWSARRAAERIGVTGWVRNRPDRAVEAHVEGSEERVSAMVSWLREGPADGRVDAIEVSDGEVEGAIGFQILA
jgi:acylphosphatase